MLLLKQANMFSYHPLEFYLTHQLIMQLPAIYFDR